MSEPVIYTKRWHVARLFLAKLITKNEYPENIEWKPIDELPECDNFCLIWAKNRSNEVFKAFFFERAPHFYYADKLDLAHNITHFSYIGK